MSGFHNLFNSGDDPNANPVFDPIFGDYNPDLDRWAENFLAQDAQDQNSVPLPGYVPDPTLDGPVANAAAGTFDDFDQSQFHDLPNFEAPSDHTVDAAPTSTMALPDANQGTNQVMLTTPQTQTHAAQPMPNMPTTQTTAENDGSEFDIDFDTSFANNAGPTNNATGYPPKPGKHELAAPYPVNNLLQSQYSSPPEDKTTNPALRIGEYPPPSPLKTEWPNLERKLFQQRGMAMAGAGVNHSGNNFQVLTAGNGITNPQYGIAAVGAGAGAGASPSHNNFQVFAASNGSSNPQLHTGSQGNPNAFGHGQPTALAYTNGYGDHAQHVVPSQGTAHGFVSNLDPTAGPSVPAPMPATGFAAAMPVDQGSGNDGDASSSLVVPVKKEIESKTSGSKKKKSTSKAKQEAVKVPIYKSELLVKGSSEAKQIAIKRIPLKVVKDDREEVRSHPEVWIPKISKALSVDFKAEAEDNDRLTEEGRKEFTRWQKEHENKAWAILTEHDDIPKFAQACARIFYDKVLEAHDIGLEDVAKTISNGGADLNTKCSERINAAIKAIEEYSIVKYDFLKQDRLEALAASPTGFVSRKVENMFVNYKKKIGTGPVKVEVDGKDSMAVSKAKSQGERKRKRKRKSPSPDISDDESEEQDYGDDDESDIDLPRPMKRSKGTNKTK